MKSSCLKLGISNYLSCKLHCLCLLVKVVSPSLSSGSVSSPAQLVAAANLPAELAAKLKEINPPSSNNMGIIDVAARIKVSDLKFSNQCCADIFCDIMQY